MEHVELVKWGLEHFPMDSGDGGTTLEGQQDHGRYPLTAPRASVRCVQLRKGAI